MIILKTKQTRRRQQKMPGSDSDIEEEEGWDGDQYVDAGGDRHDNDDADFEWNTGHTPCGDDDN